MVFSNLHPDTGLLQYFGSSEQLQREVLRDYPAFEGVGYQEVKGVRAGVAVLNPEYQDAHNQENQFYVGASCGFGLTH